MRRPVFAALALTATAALGTFALAPAGAAPSASAGHPSSVAGKARPTPSPAFQRAVRAALRATAPTRVSAAPGPSGLRDANGILTDLPTRVSLSSSEIAIPFTVVTPANDLQTPALQIGLTLGDTSDDPQFGVTSLYLEGTPGQSTYRGTLQVSARAIRTSVMLGYWYIAYGTSRGGPGADLEAVGYATTTVGYTSLIAESLTRRGDTIRVVGATKALHVPDHAKDGTTFVGRPGARVGIDRYAGQGKYVRVATVTTDRLGHIDTTVRIPWTVGLRLTTADGGGVFGASTPIKPI